MDEVRVKIGLIGMFPLLFMHDRKAVFFDDDEMELFQLQARAAAGDAAARDTIARAAACRCALAPLRAVHTPRILRARSSRRTG